MALSFSYMSFVIKDMIERKDPCMQYNEFDFEPYNYLFNKRTSFTDDCALLHPDELKEVLDQLNSKGIEMLSILNYTRPIEEDPDESKKETNESFLS